MSTDGFETSPDRVLAAAALRAGDDVLALGAAALLAFGAHERIVDGWVFAVDPSVAALEELLRAAHERKVAGIMYLVGEPDVIPLPDRAVDVCLLRSPLADAGDLTGVATELARVLRAGGRVSGCAQRSSGDARASDGALASALVAAGFDDVAVALEPDADGAATLWVTARRP
jgi:ubiquinone/menaquinone biosynthesis C-methylase UbiE